MSHDQPSLPAAGPAAAPPLLDTPDQRDALDCPLCRYSLRGLAAVNQPQCPECGYRFQWVELLRARQHAHPYLFEHHPRHSVRSLLRTLLSGFRPRRFWSSLNAAHEISPRRLFAYWLVVAAAIVFAGYGGAFASHAVTLYYMDLMWGIAPPSPLDATFLRRVARETFDEDSFDLYLLIAAVAWPWLTMSVLLVYQASMHRAKVRPAHVMRCVVYSGDVFVSAGAALAALGVLRWYGILDRSRMWDSGLAVRQTAVCFLLILALATYRLGVAYARYLRFDHPWATVLASQVIVFLIATIALSWLYEDFWWLMPAG